MPLKLKPYLCQKKNQYIGIDAPAGFIKAYANTIDNKLSVSFDNVPSFVECLDQQVEVNGIGKIKYDIAFGGAYYAFVDADELNIDCTPENQQQLIDLGRAIKHAVMQQYPLQHPEADDLGFLYGTIFHSSKTDAISSHSRHVCIFADGEVDRSPTGTGVSARAALLKEKEDLPLLKDVVIESIVGGKMTVTIQQQTDFYGKEAIIPRVSGRAFVTGCHQFMLANDDIFPNGFLLR